MTRSNKKQPTDKKPVVANNKLWRELTEGLQGKVRGGVGFDKDPLTGGGGADDWTM